MDDLYRANILEHFRSPHHAGMLEHPDASYEDYSPTCGDRVRMDFLLDEGRIADVRFNGRGCALSQAGASMLTDMLPGLSLEEALALDKEDILEELGIQVGPGRLKCALLGLKVMKRAIAGKQWQDDEL